MGELQEENRLVFFWYFSFLKEKYIASPRIPRVLRVPDKLKFKRLNIYKAKGWVAMRLSLVFRKSSLFTLKERRT